MKLKIHHSTRYRFETPVTYALQQVRKTPKSTHQQTVLDWSTRIIGGKKELTFEDHHNNTTELISFARNTTELEVISDGHVVLTDTQGIVGRHLGPAPLWLYRRETERTGIRAGVRELVCSVSADSPLEWVHALSARIREVVTYEVGVSHPRWSAEDAIAAGRGVCQDHTHIFIACARHMGIPARYVSGYLMLDDRTTQDAMHAWAEAHIDGLGWVGYDVSNGISPDTRYVRVATGLDYSDASPVAGTRIGGAGEMLEVAIDVAQQ
ncbi:transglutaminase family protein [Roseovarius amoyensis]|uniref:transglutaminase family protein n=1 Tax=Roseovarius amoyensis TaxID=2211448 RepID=UPI000DBE9112|nr:transglutaminase family protein [Roseovarius amoyensis]